MILSGGENIAGSEAKRVIYEHESVVEQQRGRPTAWGEVPVAYVVLEGAATTPTSHRPCSRQTGEVQGAQGRPLLEALRATPPADSQGELSGSSVGREDGCIMRLKGRRSRSRRDRRPAGGDVAIVLASGCTWPGVEA